MKEANPRSQLASMKLRYFLTVVGMMIGLFMIVLVPAEIGFMIFETEPYITLLVVLILFGLVAVAVYRVVNYRWIERWTRVEAEEPDPEIPEPEYVFDDEMAQKLLVKEKEKKKQPLFSGFRRKGKAEETDGKEKQEPAALPTGAVSAAATADLNQGGQPSMETEAKPEEPAGSDWKTLFEDQETIELSAAEDSASGMIEEPYADHSLNYEESLQDIESAVPQEQKAAGKPLAKSGRQRKEKAAKEKKQARKAPEREGRRTAKAPEKEELPATAAGPGRESVWAIPFDELPTADLSSLADQASEKTPGEHAAEGSRKKSAKPEKKQKRRSLFHREKEETILEVTSHADGTSTSRTVTEKKKNSRRKEKQEIKEVPVEKKAVSERRKKKAAKKPAPASAPAQNRMETPVQQAASAWAVPFEEMPTEEMQKAVENALDGGYNPFSDDRNK